MVTPAYALPSPGPRRPVPGLSRADVDQTRVAWRRRRVSWGATALAIGLLAITPHAAEAQTTQCFSGSGGNWAVGGLQMLGPNWSAIGFNCVVGTVWGGGGQPGPAYQIAQNLKTTAELLFPLIALWEIAAIAVFGPFNVQQGFSGTQLVPLRMARALMKILAVSLLLANYNLIVEALRSVAVTGSAFALEEITNSGNPNGSSTMLLAQGNAHDQAVQLYSRYLELKDTSMAAARASDPNLQQEFTNLKQFVTDSSACLQQATTAAFDDDSRTNASAVCREIQNVQGATASQWAQMKTAVPGLTASEFLDVLFKPANMVVWAASRVITYVSSLALGAVAAVVALGFVYLAAIGPLFLVFLPAEHTAGIGKFWFRSMLSFALVPILFNFALGVYAATSNAIGNSGDNPGFTALMSVVGAAFLLLVVVFGMQGLSKVSGGALQMGMAAGQVAATAAMTGGMSLAGAAKAGMATPGTLGQRVGAGMREVAKAGAGATIGFGARMFGGAGGLGDPESSERLSKTVEAGAGVAGMAVKRGLAKAGIGMKSDLAAPTRGPVTPIERNFAEARAGHDLAEMLKADDMQPGADGGVQLTASGRQKVDDYRQRNRQAMRSLAELPTADDFVRQDGVQAHMRGRVESPLDPVLGRNDGTPQRAIAEHLPAAVKGQQPGESAEGHRDRLTRLSRSIAAQAGGTWEGAQRSLQLTSNLANRSARSAEGQRYGLDVSQISPDVPPRQRTYTAQDGSLYEQIQAYDALSGHERTGEAVYQEAQRRASREVPRAPAESDEAYQERIHQHVFLAGTPT